ncbi:MAG: YfhO family protein, partial [Candidatus Kapaibacteriota bacterium]
ISEIYYPYWKAYIDGKETNIIKANYAFRAIVVPAGRHTIEMKFISPGFERGKTYSFIANVLTIIIIGLGVYLSITKKKQHPKPN